MNSPLGRYGQIVAAGLAAFLVVAWVMATMFQNVLGLSAPSLDRLQLFAGVAVGAVFGAAATVNGVKGPIDSAHNRIDKIETATGIPTHGTYPTVPGEPPPPPA